MVAIEDEADDIVDCEAPLEVTLVVALVVVVVLLVVDSPFEGALGHFVLV